jgi:hypothetical protein
LLRISLTASAKDKNNMSQLKNFTIVAVIAALAGGTYYFVAPSQKIKPIL